MNRNWSNWNCNEPQLELQGTATGNAMKLNARDDLALSYPTARVSQCLCEHLGVVRPCDVAAAVDAHADSGCALNI